MNFLAHFQLAWPDEGLVAGGLEGDFYKGRLCGQLPGNIERGVRLHRAIDAFTDNHPVIAQLRRDFPPTLRRYAGILIDLSFDHYLSLHWEKFVDIPLQEFNEQVYRLLLAQQHQLSTGSRTMLARLVEHDILGLYISWDTVPASAERIGRRFSRGNPFVGVDEQLSPARQLLEQAFLDFYPQLQRFSEEQERQLNPGTASLSDVALEPKSP